MGDEEEVGEPPGLVGDAGQLLGPVHRAHKIVILLIGRAGGSFATQFRRVQVPEPLHAAVEEIECCAHGTLLGIALVGCLLRDAGEEFMFASAGQLPLFARQECQGQVRGYVIYKILEIALLNEPVLLQDTESVWSTHKALDVGGCSMQDRATDWSGRRQPVELYMCPLLAALVCAREIDVPHIVAFFIEIVSKPPAHRLALQRHVEKVSSASVCPPNSRSLGWGSSCAMRQEPIPCHAGRSSVALGRCDTIHQEPERAQRMRRGMGEAFPQGHSQTAGGDYGREGHHQCRGAAPGARESGYDGDALVALSLACMEASMAEHLDRCKPTVEGCRVCSQLIRADRPGHRLSEVAALHGPAERAHKRC